MSSDIITIDFETRSDIDLKKVGTARYSEQDTTEVLMLCYKIGNQPVRSWRSDAWLDYLIMEDDPPQDLFDAIASGMPVEAHNAFFERMIWKNIMVKRYGWPPVPSRQWRCSAAKAAAVSLPRALGDAAKAMKLPVEKDEEGHKLMMRLCKPRAVWTKWAAGNYKDRKGVPRPEPEKYFGSEEEFERLLEYCIRDVETEHALSASIPNLKQKEWEVWHVDQEMNERGIKCDIPMAEHMIDLIEQYREAKREELQMLTDGEVQKETKRKQVLAWFLKHDTVLPDASGEFVPIDNTQAATLDEVAEVYSHDNYNRGRVATIIRQLNKSSVSKYRAMIMRASEHDQRARDTLLYHGAGTGRWSGRGIQLQNIPSGKIKNMVDSVDKAMKLETLNDIYMEYDDPMTIFSSLIRGALVPDEGKDFFVADYSSIEARGVMWVAGETDGLKVFHAGDCIYCDMASDIYGHPVDKALAKAGDFEHAEARGLGKRAVLGLGYQMGASKFLNTCEKGGQYFEDDLIDKIVKAEDQERLEVDIRENPILNFSKGKIIEEQIRPLILSKFVVERYRTKYSKVASFWRRIEDAAMAAVQEWKDGVPTAQRDWVPIEGFPQIKFKVINKFLFMKLPSGRHLAYPYPNIKMKKTAWKTRKPTLVFMGVDSFTHKWTEQTTYGGKLTENAVQAIARDIMAHALVLLDHDPDFTPVLSVHDEGISEGDETLDEDALSRYEQILARKPKWAKGFPVEVEGWRGKRYRK